MRILYQIRLVFKTDVQPDGLVRLIDDYLVFARSHSVLPYGKQYTIPAVFLLVFSYANYGTASSIGNWNWSLGSRFARNVRVPMGCEPPQRAVTATFSQRNAVFEDGYAAVVGKFVLCLLTGGDGEYLLRKRLDVRVGHRVPVDPVRLPLREGVV